MEYVFPVAIEPDENDSKQLNCQVKDIIINLDSYTNSTLYCKSSRKV